MKYYKVVYQIGRNNEYIYPSGVKGAVWNEAQYHYTDKMMIGRTESPVQADGSEVVELTEPEALSLIKEFKESYPPKSEEERPFDLNRTRRG